MLFEHHPEAFQWPIARDLLMSEQFPATIREADRTDSEWIGHFLRAHWSATTVVVHGEIINAAALPALTTPTIRGSPRIAGMARMRSWSH